LPCQQGLDTNPPKGLLLCNLLVHAHFCSFQRARDLVFERAGDGFSNERHGATLSYLVCALHYGCKAIKTIPVDYPNLLDVVVCITKCQLILSGSDLSPSLVELDSLWTRFEEIKYQAWENVDLLEDLPIYWTSYAALELVKEEYAEAAKEWDPVWKRMREEEEKDEGTVRWRLPTMEPGQIPAKDEAMECRCCGANDLPLRFDSKVEVFGAGTVLM